MSRAPPPFARASRALPPFGRGAGGVALRGNAVPDSDNATPPNPPFPREGPVPVGGDDSAWRLKRIHRMIVLSSTYAQSSAWRDKAARIDPESVAADVERWLAGLGLAARPRAGVALEMAHAS